MSSREIVTQAEELWKNRKMTYRQVRCVHRMGIKSMVSSTLWDFGLEEMSKGMLIHP